MVQKSKFFFSKLEGGISRKEKISAFLIYPSCVWVVLARYSNPISKVDIKIDELLFSLEFLP